MKLLIPGGAGYIGSHMVRHAQCNGHEVTVLDNFSTGHRWAVQDVEVLDIDLLDKENLLKNLNNRYFDGVIHFAAKSLVGESIVNPSSYYLNNVTGTLNLLDCMLKNDIENIVFSSTAAIFGKPNQNKIDETHPKKPINTYGKSKLIIEEILKDYAIAYGLKSTSLRYFNAAGADPLADIGEAHIPETHLIPNVINSIFNKEIKLEIFGDDYSTFDGTCIRDYVHVNDLASAHLLALQNKTDENFCSFNLGNGNGFSILQIIESVEKISGKKIEFSYAPRRKGDPDTLVSDSSKAKKEIGWSPIYNEIESIIETAYKWHENLFLKDELK